MPESSHERVKRSLSNRGLKPVNMAVPADLQPLFVRLGALARARRGDAGFRTVLHALARVGGEPASEYEVDPGGLVHSFVALVAPALSDEELDQLAEYGDSGMTRFLAKRERDYRRAAPPAPSAAA